MTSTAPNTDAPPGALSQDVLRRAAGMVGRAYAQLRAAVPAAPVVHTDDTGWRVGGSPPT